MPDFPTEDAGHPRIDGNTFNVHFVAAGQDPADVGLDELGADVTAAELAVLRTRWGNLSNAAVQKTTHSITEEVSKGVINPLDESYSDAATKLILLFQNATLQSRQIAIPAPDEAYFGLDGISIITPDGGAAAGTPARLLFDAIAQTVLVLNGGAAADPQGTFVFLRGYRSNFARKLPKPRGTARVSIEPAVGVEPGDEPGT